jgi:hypothetical protein
MLMKLSAVLNTPVGMLVGWLLPACCGIAVHQPARRLEIQHEDLRLSSEVCTHWPSPDTSRSSSAVMMPSAQVPP